MYKPSSNLKFQAVHRPKLAVCMRKWFLNLNVHIVHKCIPSSITKYLVYEIRSLLLLFLSGALNCKLRYSCLQQFS